MTPNLKYKELPDGRKVLDVRTGDRFRANMAILPYRGLASVVGKIYVSEDHVIFLCQNEAEGSCPSWVDLQGYKYSWTIGSGTEEETLEFGVQDLVVTGEVPPSDGTLTYRGITLTYEEVERLYQEVQTLRGT